MAMRKWSNGAHTNQSVQPNAKAAAVEKLGEATKRTWEHKM